jgi:hypothetical protein
MTRAARAGRWIIFGLCALTAGATALRAQEARQLGRIQRPKAEAPLYTGRPLALPTREACEQAVRTIAGDYRPGGLDRHLADEFLYRQELLDLLAKVAVYATRIELRVESIESVRVDPWRVAPGRKTLTSDCLADVRTRLTFDDPSTGIRTVRDVGRAQWRVRFYADAPR